MYDEFIKRLRERAGAFDYDGRPDIACDYEQAADAIEELSRENESLAKSVNEASEILRRRWIPVTERLPEEYVDVLCYCSRNGRYGCGEWSKEDNGTVYWTGLYGMIPTHWMPLPEPPKEE